jgi:hypothetical protein
MQSLVLTTCLGVVVGVTPNANYDSDAHMKMSVVAMAPEASFHSDMAFWGRHAFVGYYGGDALDPSSGIRIFDIF